MRLWEGSAKLVAIMYADYVQDERYAAGAGMRTTAGTQEVEQCRSKCRGAAPPTGRQS